MCIVCKTPADGRTRGLCVAHYNRFLKSIRKLPSEEQKRQFEEMLINKGQLLPSQQGKRKGPDDNVFAEALEEFQASIDSGSSPAAQKALDEARRATAELEKKIDPPKEGHQKRARPRVR